MLNFYLYDIQLEKIYNRLIKKNFDSKFLTNIISHNRKITKFLRLGDSLIIRSNLKYQNIISNKYFIQDIGILRYNKNFNYNILIAINLLLFKSENIKKQQSYTKCYKYLKFKYRYRYDKKQKIHFDMGIITNIINNIFFQIGYLCKNWYIQQFISFIGKKNYDIFKYTSKIIRCGKKIFFKNINFSFINAKNIFNQTNTKYSLSLLPKLFNNTLHLYKYNFWIIYLLSEIIKMKYASKLIIYINTLDTQKLYRLTTLVKNRLKLKYEYNILYNKFSSKSSLLNNYYSFFDGILCIKYTKHSRFFTLTNRQGNIFYWSSPGRHGETTRRKKKQKSVVNEMCAEFGHFAINAGFRDIKMIVHVKYKHRPYIYLKKILSSTIIQQWSYEKQRLVKITLLHPIILLIKLCYPHNGCRLPKPQRKNRTRRPKNFIKYF